VTDWNLTGSWVANSGQNAIRVENAAGWTIENNHLYGVGASGISADRLFGSCVCNNYVEDFNLRGITVTVQGAAASTVAGNRVFLLRGTGSTFLEVSQTNYGTGQLASPGTRCGAKATGWACRTSGGRTSSP